MNRILAVAILALAITGCSKSRPSQLAHANSPSKQASTSQAPLAPDAQRILYGLNAWNKDAIDVVERPTAHPNMDDSGETRAYINDAKKELAKLNVKVQWNHEKRIYEVIK